MSPELKIFLLNENEINELDLFKCNIYSLGIILIQMILLLLNFENNF